MDAELQKAIDDLGRDWKEFRATNDERLKAIEAKQGTAEFDTKLAAINKDISDVKAQINRAMLGSQLIAGGLGEPSALTKELVGWMRNPSRNGQFVAQVNQTTNADGGYLSLPEIDSEISRVAEKTVAMRRLANIKTIGRASYVKNINKGGVTAGWVAEAESRTGNTATPAMAQIEIFAREIFSLPGATQETLDDLGFDVAAWLAEECGTAFADTEDAAFISGDGAGKPKGFLAQTMVADASYAWGKIGFIASGKAGAFADTAPADKIIDLIHALKAKYRNGASFLTNDLTLAQIRKIKDGQNNYLWQPSFQPGIPDRLAGYPCEVSDNMPDIAANSYSIAFGNWKQGYQIVDRKGVRILADPYTTKGIVSFYTYKRVGGDVLNFEAIKVMKFSA